MRTILVTGPGGAGRSTAAAATALTAARAGHRTLVLSADPADGLGAALATPTGPDPVRIAGPDAPLTAWRPAAAPFGADLLRLQEWAAPALDLAGAARLEAEELTPLPGAEEAAVFRALRESAQVADTDVVVVDLPPLDRALSLLALPPQLRRYLRRLLPAERRAASGLRPVLGRLAGIPLPTEGLYETVDRWDRELAAVEAVVAAPTTTVRLVAEPGPAAITALATATTGFALHALRVDALLASRTLPRSLDGDAAGTWLAGPLAQQRAALDDWTARPAAPVHELPHLGREPRGLDDLAALGVPLDAAPPRPVHWPVEDRLAADGVLVWTIPLPGAVRGELDLLRRGDELVLTVGRFRRIVPLPSALRRCTVTGAGLSEGALRVRCTPDPALWPRK
ncbi:ArsA-related P-loop ATPase [Streptomyces sp. LE64]|uniref:ArsA-related P-loop ATPase n=1 Tax=Streptomyces sp. LE64 TaxID=3448653 RepID=UPI0040424210